MFYVKLIVMSLAPVFIIGLSFALWKMIFAVERFQKIRQDRELIKQQESVRIAPDADDSYVSGTKQVKR